MSKRDSYLISLNHHTCLCYIASQLLRSITSCRLLRSYLKNFVTMCVYTYYIYIYTIYVFIKYMRETFLILIYDASPRLARLSK